MESLRIVKEKDTMQLNSIKYLLDQTCWANDRNINLIQKSIENSICFSIIDTRTNMQVGFARVITDYTTIYYLCDVIIDKKYRENGLGCKLIDAIVNDQDLRDLEGVFATKNTDEICSRIDLVDQEHLFLEKSAR